MNQSIESSEIDRRILLIRGQRVMLDFDLARIYGVSTSRLNQQVNRNKGRFPEDFTFQLTAEEAVSSRLQIATLKKGRGGNLKYLPHAYTEHGAVAAAFVLNSEVAVAASIRIVRVFNHMRRMAAANKEVALKLIELEDKVGAHDVHIRALFAAIRRFLEPPPQPPREIGFKP
jgi:hypothetical protein